MRRSSLPTDGSGRTGRPGRSTREPFPAGFGTIWSTVAIDLIGFGIVLPILPQYAERFNASATTIGLLVASFSVAQLIGAPLLGRLSDRIGRKPILIVSLFGTALGSLLTGVAGGIALLFLGRIIDGASGASVSVAQASAADLAPPHQRARLMGLLGAAFGVGFVAGPAIGALGSLIGPKAPFFIAAAISFVNALVAIRRLPETAPGHASTVADPAGAGAVAGAPAVVVDAAVDDAERIAAAVSADGAGLVEPAHLEEPTGPQGGGGAFDRPAILRLILLSFVGMVAFSGFEATFSLLGEARFGFSLAATGGVFTVIGIALVGVQGGLVGPVNDRLPETVVLRFGLAANAVGLLLLAINGGWFTLIASLTFLVLGQGLLTPTLSSAIAGRAGAQRGQWLGWHQSAGGLARVLGPITAGALFEHVGLGAPYLVGAALVAVALLLVPPASLTV